LAINLRLQQEEEEEQQQLLATGLEAQGYHFKKS
jgi:hypothetical protein